jgi:DNA-directed RNA polymerase subunit omega
MDEATAERLARRVGGRFKLATLVMKRLIEINRGSQILVEPPSENLIDAVLKEVDLDLARLVPRLPAPGEEAEELAQADEAGAEDAAEEAEEAKEE